VFLDLTVTAPVKVSPTAQINPNQVDFLTGHPQHHLEWLWFFKKFPLEYSRS